MKRRKFLKKSTLSTAGLMAAPLAATAHNPTNDPACSRNSETSGYPMVIATWDVPNATAKAWEILQKGGNALDAVEQGVKVEEADESNQSVGKGGRPDRDGHVTLDACIMDSSGNCGSVVYLRNILHPVSVARKVMEETPHVILAGKGAEQFAYEMGFKKTDLLTARSREEWEAWKSTSKYEPVINIENHDTIGMLALDATGNISGACTTSGLAYKMAGRVGDSPIIGAGLYVDNEVGGATATGLGEEVVRTVGSFLIVELMRQGKSPQQACEEAVQRIIARKTNYRDFQVGFIAVNKNGETGGYCIHPGFSYRIFGPEGHKNHASMAFIAP
jgi:N4-(beta-N-acetylglucosaminyl)-L-asparaginase